MRRGNAWTFAALLVVAAVAGAAPAAAQFDADDGCGPPPTTLTPAAQSPPVPCELLVQGSIPVGRGWQSSASSWTSFGW